MHTMEHSLNQDSSGKKKRIEFKWLRTEELKPNPWNPNRMSSEMASKLKAELKRFGMILPIVVRPLREKACGEGFLPWYQIIDGEHRWLIAKELGMSSVPCIVVELNDAEARLKTIQLNRLRGEDEPELLARLLRELEMELGLVELTARLPFTKLEIEQSLELMELQSFEEARKKLAEEMSEMLKERVFSVVVSETEKAIIEYTIHFFNSRAGKSLSPGSVLAKICESFLENSGEKILR